MITNQSGAFRLLLLTLVSVGFVSGQSFAQDQEPTDSDTKRLSEINGLTGPQRDLFTKPRIILDESASELTQHVSFNDLPHATLISMPAVQRELEIVESQLEDIAAARKDALRDFERLEERYDNTKDEKQRAEIERRAKQVVEDFHKQVKSIILPHQWKALDAFLYRGVVQRIGLLSAITAGPIADTIGIRADQRVALRKEAAVLKEELEEKIRELQKDAVERILSKLDRRQRSDLEELVGGDLEEIMAPNLSKLVLQLDGLINEKPTE